MTSTHCDIHLIESGVVSAGFEYANVSKRKDKLRKYSVIEPCRVRIVEGKRQGSTIVIVDGYKFRFTKRWISGDDIVKYYGCVKKCGVNCRLSFDREGKMVKAEINVHHNHPYEDITMPYQKMKRG